MLDWSSLWSRMRRVRVRCYTWQHKGAEIARGTYWEQWQSWLYKCRNTHMHRLYREHSGRSQLSGTDGNTPCIYIPHSPYTVCTRTDLTYALPGVCSRACVSISISHGSCSCSDSSDTAFPMSLPGSGSTRLRLCGTEGQGTSVVFNTVFGTLSKVLKVPQNEAENR